MTQVFLFITSFVCAALIAYALTPAVRVLAFKLGAVDVPLDKRRVHKRPVPRIGGLAIYTSFLACTALFCDVDRSLVTIWIGGFVIVVVGILDDIFRLNAWIKLIVQIAVAAFAIINGSVIEHIFIKDSFVSLGFFGYILSFIWIVGLTNAINFIDGLDGLACGVSAIATTSMLAVVLLNGDFLSAGLCVIMLGSCLGFLPYNRNPAKIFMGDTGAMFLGFAMAVMSINGAFKMHALLSFIVPILIFAIPIFDGLFSIIRRLAH
ncbi:MAG: undecaprenyl/decaprenyl-phosphate alpha-N-acetylglucosaminyl 1-phosphate transferase, partial [Lachnospiraceae bacterium]|nr:undecaprenyl/decaprenyl-phosphate alpha-N-acetylglucosaminyl 1-phosphate transferase [Lachnospiraceae bacterium]